MPYTILFNDQNQIIEGVISGDVDITLLRQYAIDAEKLIKQVNCQKILTDYKLANLSFSVIELYKLPTTHLELFDSLGANIYTLKRASVFKKEDTEMAAFFENVAVNRGQIFKVFSEKSDALNWLISD